jgi:hypothetical protein
VNNFMKTQILEHPAVQFGQWLKGKRRESGTVARVFAGRIDLSPAEYAEVESGIVHWLEEKQVSRIPLLLGLDEQGEADFNYKLRLAKQETELSFSDVYGEEELAPARCSSTDGNQINEERRKAIIKAVFSPLHTRA